MHNIKSLLSDQKKDLILLVKPQFEVGKELVGKKGVVRDALSHIKALNEIINFSNICKLKMKGLIASPLTGPAGNHEYLLWLGTNGFEKKVNINHLVYQTLNLKS